MWASIQLYLHTPGDLLETVRCKSICRNLDKRDTQMVFNVLSQWLCLDLVLSNGEAIKLSNQSISHMQILSSYSQLQSIFYMHSPSEPILALAAFDLMYLGDQTYSEQQNHCNVLYTTTNLLI